MSTCSPNLQLPQRTGTTRKQSSSVSFGVYVLLLAIIGLQVWMMARGSVAPAMSTNGSANGYAETAKAVALKLEDRNLSEAAADAWKDYLAAVSLNNNEEAAIRYRIGKLLQDSARYQKAVQAYYLAENLLADTGSDLNRQITMRVRECLQKLGRFSDLTREMAERADMTGDPATSLQGRQVVAEIDGESISISEFDRLLSHQIEQSIAMQVGMPPEHAQQLRKQAHAQFADPQAKMEQLQQIIASRVLAEEARNRGLEDSQAFRSQLVDFADRLLATQLLLDETTKRGTVTPQDIERFYEANKDRYADPAEVTIARITCPSKVVAEQVIAEASAGKDFTELARQNSLIEQEQESGGVVNQPVREGSSFVPGAGANPEMHEAIIAASPGSVLEEAYEVGDRWQVIKVVDRKERVQRSFEEVNSSVDRDVRAARRAEVTQQYIEELFKARNVQFHPEAFASSVQKMRTNDSPDESRMGTSE